MTAGLAPKRNTLKGNSDLPELLKLRKPGLHIFHNVRRRCHRILKPSLGFTPEFVRLLSNLDIRVEYPLSHRMSARKVWTVRVSINIFGIHPPIIKDVLAE